MKYTKRRFRTSFSKNKKVRNIKRNTKRNIKRNTKRNIKRNRFTKKRTHKGGYTWLETWNLQKYANDSEVQTRLASYFNEPSVVGNPEAALSVLKANNSLYKSINDLFKEIGVDIDDYNENVKLGKSNIAIKQFDEDLKIKEQKMEQYKREREREMKIEKEKQKEQERAREKLIKLNNFKELRERELANRKYMNEHRGEIQKSFFPSGVNNTPKKSYSDRRQ